VVFGNDGTEDAHGVPIVIDGLPEDAEVDPDVDVRPPVVEDADDRRFVEQLPITLENGRVRILPVFLKRIPAGRQGSFTLTITSRRDLEMRLRAWADPPYFQPRAGAQEPGGLVRLEPSRAAGGCLTALVKFGVEQTLDAVLPFECARNILSVAADVLEDSPDDFFEPPGLGEAVYSEVQFWGAVMKTTASCVKEAIPGAELVEELLDALEKGNGLVDVAKECERTFTGGLGAVDGPDTAGGSFAATVLRVLSGSSVDPNDKAASAGRGRRFVTGDETLRYAVFFENLETATLPAQEVRITDDLDPATLDLDSFRLGAVNFGTRRVDPPPGASAMSTDVDLRPQQNLIVRVEASLDRASGRVVWRLRGLDPATQAAPADPAAGFLPPNRSPPEGDGSVVFTIRAKRRLATGTAIRNNASIVFDQNAPVVTPATLNLVDNSRPSSVVRSVVRRSARRFRVSWSARDRGSGLARFTAFASEDGKPFEAFAVGTKRRAASFTGRPGKRYTFYVAATDKAGNLEPAPAAGDLATPALRTRRSGGAVELSTKVFVQSAGEVAVSARGRRGLKLLAGSRIGKLAGLAGAKSMTRSLARPATVRLTLRLRPGDVRAAGRGLRVLVRGTGGSLVIPVAR
jgi:hypothetical protein